MEPLTNREKFLFWKDWTLSCSGIITLSYLLSLIAVLLVHGAFGFNMEEWGTPFSQTLMQMAGGALIGLGTGLYQKSLLIKLFDVKSSWIYTLITGFVVTELITGVILWKLNLNRAELRFIEFNPMPESLIFACIGLLTGILQWPLLKKHFRRSGYWIIACITGWGILILINFLSHISLIRNSILASILVFALGALLYGAITGATLIWLMELKGLQKKDNE
jgi:hypothetical protein